VKGFWLLLLSSSDINPLVISVGDGFYYDHYCSVIGVWEEYWRILSLDVNLEVKFG
jgi:hypothetical protein